MSYTCVLCNVCFDRPNKLEKHKMTSKHITKESITCDKQDLIKEIIRLRQKTAELEDTKKQLKSVESANLTMMAEMKHLESRVHKLEQNNTEHSITQNIEKVYNDNRTIVNIHVNNHGSENWTYLSHSKLYDLMKGTNTFLPELVKLLHFNKQHPENHNIKFKNQRLKQMLIIQNDKWQMIDKDHAIDSLVKSIIDKVEYDDNLKSFYQKHSTHADKIRWNELKESIGYEHPSTNKRKEKEHEKKVVDTIVQEQRDLLI